MNVYLKKDTPLILLTHLDLKMSENESFIKELMEVLGFFVKVGGASLLKVLSDCRRQFFQILEFLQYKWK